MGFLKNKLSQFGRAIWPVIADVFMNKITETVRPISTAVGT